MTATGRRIGFFWVVLIAALCFAQTALTNDSIIKMVKAGLGEEVIIPLIQAQPANYSTEPDILISLKAAGVSDKIIAAMMAKGSGSAPSVASSNTAPNAVSEKGPEREFQRTVYWLDRGNNKLISLERQQVNPGAKAMPFVGAKVTLEVKGKRSPVRFPADSKPEFVFSAPQNVDPQGLAQIFRLTVKKDHRELLMAAKRTPFGRIRHEQDKESVSFQASKYNDSSIRITPTVPLPPGEYGIRVQVGSEMFCFGVN